MVKKILFVLLAILIIIQFIHPKKNISDGSQPNFIGNKFSIPDDVSSIMKVACYDCHTNNTRYPWYTKIQPVHWWLEGHVREGKENFNLDEFTTKRLRAQYHQMEEMIEMVKEGEMPLKSYTWIHKDARLTDEERNKLVQWAESVMKSLEANYPMDSLMRREN